MEINREMILLYALGRVQNPDHRALIEERITNDAEVAGWLEQLRSLGQPLPDDDALDLLDDDDVDDFALDPQAWEDLRYFFPDGVSPRDYLQGDAQVETRGKSDFVQLAKPLQVSRQSYVGVSASSPPADVGGDQGLEAIYRFDKKRKQLYFFCPESLASFDFGVGLVRVYQSKDNAAQNDIPLATALFAVKPISGAYEKRIPLNAIKQGLVVDRKTRARFWDATEEILAECTIDSLRELLTDHDFGDEWREKVARLIELKRKPTIS